jgi:hypothetical protein
LPAGKVAAGKHERVRRRAIVDKGDRGTAGAQLSGAAGRDAQDFLSLAGEPRRLNCLAWRDQRRLTQAVKSIRRESDASWFQRGKAADRHR